jgi:excisionase family DNA binding protein
LVYGTASAYSAGGVHVSWFIGLLDGPQYRVVRFGLKTEQIPYHHHEQGELPAQVGGPLFALVRNRRKVRTLEAETTDPATKVWMRPEEGAAYLGIGRTRMYALLGAQQGIPSVRIGRTRHVRRADLDAYMERRFEEAESE